jgi:hypothetical protein
MGADVAASSMVARFAVTGTDAIRRRGIAGFSVDDEISPTRDEKM